MHPDARVSTRLVQPIVAGMLMMGADAEAALGHVGLDPALLADPDARIPHQAAVALWAHAAERTGVETFGLRVVEAIDLKVFDVQMYAFLSSADLEEGIGRVIRYQRINHDVARVSLVRTPHEAIYRHELPGGRAPPGSVAQFVLGSVVKAARVATGDAIEITEVRFRHPEPEDTEEYARLLRAPCSFGNPYNEVVFPLTALRLPLLRADPGLASVLDRHAQNLLETLPRLESLVDHVRGLLAKELQGGNPSAEHIAEALRMSTRTLARRLAAEGTSHKELLDDLRSELARRYLGDPSLSIGEVAFLLGFSEPSALHRAFKRWTGQTPANARRTLVGPESSA